MDSWPAQLIIDYKYLVLLPFSAILGPIVSFLAGILIKSGYLTIVYAYLILMAGELIGDVVWYWLGRSRGEKFLIRFGKYFSITPEAITAAKIMFSKYHTRILVVSKLTTGLGFAPAVLFTAGVSRIPFKKYMALNFYGQIVWTGMLLWLGYLVGNLYSQFSSFFERLTITAIIVAIMLFVLGYGKYLRNKITRS